jgi:hypothetical protein
VEILAEEPEEEPEPEQETQEQASEEPVMAALEVSPPATAPVAKLEIPAPEMAVGDIGIEAAGGALEPPLGRRGVNLAGHHRWPAADRRRQAFARALREAGYELSDQQRLVFPGVDGGQNTRVELQLGLRE